MIKGPSVDENKFLYYAYNTTVVILLTVVIIVNVRFSLYFLGKNLSIGSSSAGIENTSARGRVFYGQDFNDSINAKYKKITLKIDGVNFETFVANTAELQDQGLSGWPSLAPHQGMLFVFGKEGKYPFWMKDMSFPIDIVWLDSNYKIVHLESALSPETYPNTFGADVKAKYVLELPARTVNIDSTIGLY